VKRIKLLHFVRPAPKISLPFFRISANHKHIPRPQEGRFAIVTGVGRGMRWTRSCCETSSMARTVKSCGPDPPTLGSSLRDSRRRWWLKSPVHQGEREAAVKTVAQGMPVVSAGPVVTAACVFCCRRAMGAASIRHSLRPLLIEDAIVCKIRTLSRRGNAEPCPQTPPSFRGATKSRAITTIGSMVSGLAAPRRPGLTKARGV
jgi:hypothetical protein